MLSGMYNQDYQEKTDKATGSAATDSRAADSRATGSAGYNPGLSLVMRLNLRMFLHTLAVMLLINVFLCAAAGLGEILKAEEQAAAFMIDPKEKFDFSINTAPIQTEGLDLWAPLHIYTPLRDHEVRRSFYQKDAAPPYIDDLSDLEYIIVLHEADKDDLVLSYPLGAALLPFKNWFTALLIFEGIILLIGISKNARKIRRILRPLTNVTLSSQKLSSGGTIPADEMKNLRNLAGTISSIDATKLDKRLPVDGQKNELKDLATAINSMLDRIDEAYQSQVRFVSDASHELRTPISVIQGYVNLLDRWGKNDPNTLQESIDAIKSEAESMKDLIEQLLFLARGDNETLQLYPEIFDSYAMVEEILHETQMIDTLHALKIKGLGPAMLYADRQLMKQAIRILIENSIKYTPDDGEIIAAVNTENGFVSISVQDNGIGIDPNSLPYIFDRFYRSDESRARKTGGSGLGLSIMKWIIDRHGGIIEVISRKDIGTRTTIKLPEYKEMQQ